MEHEGLFCLMSVCCSRAVTVPQMPMVGLGFVGGIVFAPQLSCQSVVEATWLTLRWRLQLPHPLGELGLEL
jgi:hypothetical protein